MGPYYSKGPPYNFMVLKGPPYNFMVLKGGTFHRGVSRIDDAVSPL